jgi:AraC-like DNA-binding protein
MQRDARRLAVLVLGLLLLAIFLLGGLVKEAFGVPPHRYLLTRRIERAKALLRDTDLPIIEIALQTGWNSLGTFGRVFIGTKQTCWALYFESAKCQQRTYRHEGSIGARSR